MSESLSLIPKNKILVLYAYFEKNDEYKKNFEFFLDNAGLDDPSLDFMFIVNGKTSLERKLDQIKQKNENEIINNNKEKVSILYRENKNYDFGAWGDGLRFKQDSLDDYDYFVFLNTSVRGPFMPAYCESRMNWYDPFLEKFKKNKNVKLVGTHINLFNSQNIVLEKCKDKFFPDPPPYPHVQSQFFVTDAECLHHLIYEKGLFSFDPLRKYEFRDVIVEKEIQMSQHVLQRGWNIACLLLEFENFDFLKLKSDPRSFLAQSYDPSYSRNIHPYEVVFIKTNKEYSPMPEIEFLTIFPLA